MTPSYFCQTMLPLGIYLCHIFSSVMMHSHYLNDWSSRISPDVENDWTTKKKFLVIEFHVQDVVWKMRLVFWQWNGVYWTDISMSTWKGKKYCCCMFVIAQLPSQQNTWYIYTSWVQKFTKCTWTVCSSSLEKKQRIISTNCFSILWPSTWWCKSSSRYTQTVLEFTGWKRAVSKQSGKSQHIINKNHFSSLSQTSIFVQVIPQ